MAGSLIAITVALLAVSTARAQNLLTNPGFESGNTAWVSSGNLSVGALYSDYNPFGLSGNLVPYGTRLTSFNGGDVAPNGILSQTFATTQGAGYNVSFVFGNFSNSSAATTQMLRARTVDVTSSAVLNSLVATDIANGAQRNIDTIYDTSYSFFFVATGTSTRLEFLDQPGSTTNSSDGILDNVSVTATAVAPEPGTFALLGIATLPMGAIVSRNHRRYCRCKGSE